MSLFRVNKGKLFFIQADKKWKIRLTWQVVLSVTPQTILWMPSTQTFNSIILRSHQSGVVMVMSHKKLRMPLFPFPVPHIIEFDNLAQAQTTTEVKRQICKKTEKRTTLDFWLKTRCPDCKAEWWKNFHGICWIHGKCVFHQFIYIVVESWFP